MNDYIEMKLRTSGETVRVYNFVKSDTDSVYIFVPSMHQKCNNGWQKVKMSKLIPMDMSVNGTLMHSKTEKNRAKSMLKLVAATWQTTDGLQYPHMLLDMAIEHQLNIMNNEQKGEEIS